MHELCGQRCTRRGQRYSGSAFSRIRSLSCCAAGEPPDPHKAVPFNLIAKAIHHDGQPPELAWPYLQTLPADIGAWHPPLACAPIFHREFLLEAGSLDRIVEYLETSRPVVVVMNVSRSFYQPGSDAVINGNAKEPAINTHAVIAVGLGRRENSALLLIRNSWGQPWGLRGHAWLTEDYLRPRLLGIGAANLKES